MMKRTHLRIITKGKKQSTIQYFKISTLLQAIAHHLSSNNYQLILEEKETHLKHFKFWKELGDKE